MSKLFVRYTIKYKYSRSIPVMRFFLIGLLLVTTSTSLRAAPVSVDTSALGSDGDSNLGVGFTYSATERPYNNPDTVLAALPYFTASRNGFYINGLNLGYELTADPDPFVAPTLSLRIDILAIPRFLGYKAKESPVLEGLEDTDYSIHAGVSFSLINGPANFNVQFLTDILGESDGSEVNGTISKSFSRDKLSLTPAFSLNWQDAALVDHYYGIDASGATATRAQYSAGSVFNKALSLTAGYTVTKRLNIFGAIRVEQFGDEISDSPIVDEDVISSASIGLVYTFKVFGKKDSDKAF